MNSKKFDVLIAYIGTALLLLTPFYYLISLLTWFVDTDSQVKLVLAAISSNRGFVAYNFEY